MKYDKYRCKKQIAKDMIYKEFDSIIIDDFSGISRVGEDTKMLASHARRQNPDMVLDVGCSSGFIPIYLARQGIYCEGIDINPYAIKCAYKNAEKNNVPVRFYVSDLFEKVTKKFDLIIFNPPFGSTASARAAVYLEKIKALFPKENPIIANFVFKFVRGSRQKLIRKFLAGYRPFLQKNGKIIMYLHVSEFQLIKNYKFTILQKHKTNKNMCVGLIEEMSR